MVRIILTRVWPCTPKNSFGTIQDDVMGLVQSGINDGAMADTEEGLNGYHILYSITPGGETTSSTRLA